MNDKQKAFADSHLQLGHLLTQIDTFYQGLPAPIRRAFDELGSDLKYGCHVDLEEGQEPDHCVIEKQEYHNCVYASEGMRPSQCEYWKPIKPDLSV